MSGVGAGTSAPSDSPTYQTSAHTAGATKAAAVNSAEARSPTA